jgi:hypothetical protein
MGFVEKLSVSLLIERAAGQLNNIGIPKFYSAMPGTENVPIVILPGSMVCLGG